MLARAVQNFANDLQDVSDAIKSRTVTQIKGALQKKAFDEAGIVIQSQVLHMKSYTLENWTKF